MLRNPWHTAMVKASMTGILLADLIARTKRRSGFILMGHSLGARVVYYALQALSTKADKKQFIRDAYLFGGAVGQDREGWTAAASAVKGSIYNAHSERDSVLGVLYQTANAFQSSPVGMGPIESDADNVVNLDVTSLVSGHMRFKSKMSTIISGAVDRPGPRAAAG